MSIAPISPVEPPQVAPPAREPIGWEVFWAVVAAVAVAVLGAPFGWLWSRLAPHVELVQTQYGPYPIEGEPEGYWADDGWFILMSIGVGVLIAVAAWLLLRRYRGPLLLAGLVVGSAAASVLAAWLGNKIGYAHYLNQAEHAPVNTHIFRPVKLRTGTSSLLFGFIPWVRGTMLVQALTAAAVYTGLAGFHASPTLRYDNMPADHIPFPPGVPGDAPYPPAVPDHASYPPPAIPGHGAYPPPGASPADGSSPPEGFPGHGAFPPPGVSPGGVSYPPDAVPGPGSHPSDAVPGHGSQSSAAASGEGSYPAPGVPGGTQPGLADGFPAPPNGAPAGPHPAPVAPSPSSFAAGGLAASERDAPSSPPAPESPRHDPPA